MGHIRTSARELARSRVVKRATQIALHVACLVPLALLIWDYAHDNLTANPIQDITYRTGKTALVLLVLSLVCTPASSLLGLRAAVRWRRPLGVYAFVYVSLHFLTFVGLDYGFDTGLLGEAIFEKRYALVGFAAFLLLIPLAVTSTTGWMRRLGKRWRSLHTLVYPAVVLAVIHYIWLVKADIRVPMQYATAVSILLIVRLPPVRRELRRLLGRRASPPRPGAPAHSASTAGAATGLAGPTPPRD